MSVPLLNATGERAAQPGGSARLGWFLAAFYGLAVFTGLRNAYFWEPSSLDALLRCAWGVVLSWWAVDDSLARGRPIPFTTRGWFFLASGLLIPAYLIWSRGWRGVGWLVLHVCCLYAVSIATALVVWMLVFVGWTLMFGGAR